MLHDLLSRFRKGPARRPESAASGCGKGLWALFLFTLLAFSPAALPAEEPAPGSDAVSAASFDLSALRSLEFREGEVPSVLPIDPLPAEGPAPGDFWIAVEDTGAAAVFYQSVLPVLNALKRTFPDRRVIVEGIPSRVFVEEVRERKIPFAVATAGTTVSLMLDTGAVPLATRERIGEGAAGSAGALLLVSTEKPAPKNWEDLRGKRLALESSVSFGPWQWLGGRLVEEGYEAEDFFSGLLWRAHDAPEVLNAVASGDADAGLLSACSFELPREPVEKQAWLDELPRQYSAVGYGQLAVNEGPDGNPLSLYEKQTAADGTESFAEREFSHGFYAHATFRVYADGVLLFERSGVGWKTDYGAIAVLLPEGTRTLTLEVTDTSGQGGTGWGDCALYA